MSFVKKILTKRRFMWYKLNCECCKTAHSAGNQQYYFTNIRFLYFPTAISITTLHNNPEKAQGVKTINSNAFSENHYIKITKQLAIPIIYTLLWCEYNYRHALQLSKVPW